MKTKFNSKYPIIGMIHLGGLLGKPDFKSMTTLIDNAKRDLETLQEGGIDGVMFENDNDKPYSEFIDTPQALSFGYLMSELKKEISVPHGYTVLINDWKAALSLAKMTNADFIRLDTFVDKVQRIDDGMVIDPNPNLIMDFKKKLDVSVDIFTDVHVKHMKMLEDNTLEESISEAILHGSNGIIISGNWTGQETDTNDLLRAKKAANKEVPIIVGSGLNVNNVYEMSQVSDMAIVGSSIKTGERIDKEKVIGVVQKISS